MCSVKGPIRRRRAQKPDAQAFDEVHISTVPSFYNTSIGKEWRTTVLVIIKRNGQVYSKKKYDNIDDAVNSLGYEWLQAKRNNPKYISEESFCDQEGCKNKFTKIYQLEQEYCEKGHPSDPYEFDDIPLTRQFCNKHAVRGTLKWEDCDKNYKQIGQKKTSNNKKQKTH
jgi:hypothetical protein